jgi:hypothetical protein
MREHAADAWIGIGGIETALGELHGAGHQRERRWTLGLRRRHES